MANDFKTCSVNVVAESLGYLKILFPEMLIEGVNVPTEHELPYRRELFSRNSTGQFSVD